MALYTYDVSVRRESLLDILRDVSPITSNYLVNELATSEATNTLHEWPVYNVARPTSLTFFAEGADAANVVHTAPTRSTNITGIIERPVAVSGTQMAVKTAAMSNSMDFQKVYALKRLKADMEFGLLNGTRASGASGTARQFDGINSVISTNLTARNSGTSMSTTELEDIMQNSWDATDPEYVADTLLVTMGIKRKIATFTTRVTPYKESGDRIYNNISVYESSSGPVKVIPHKDVINGTGTTHVYALNLKMFRMAFLTGREPKWEPLAKTGDADKGHYITEMTLESLAERASVKRYGYNQNG